MALDAPEVFSGWKRTVSANGTDISEWISDWSPEAEDDIQEFQGSGGTPKARNESGRTLSLTFTVANHPTPMAIIEGAFYADPKQTVTFIAVDYSGRTTTFETRISHITENGGSGDVLTCDVETIVLSRSNG